MAEINLTQAEADALIGREKHRADDSPCDYPNLGGLISVPLRSLDRGKSSYWTFTVAASTFSR